LVAGLSRAERRLTFRRRDPRRLRTAAFNEIIDSSVRDLHTIDHYCDLVRPIVAAGGDPACPAPPAGQALLRLPPGARERAERLRQSAGIRGPYALVHPGTARVEKYWPADRWARVIAYCQSRGLPCILTGGGDPYEKSHLAAIEEGLTSHAPNFAGELDLVMLAALAAEARLVLSVDTAAAHLAAAFESPQIVLYGPTNPFHWRPRHPRVIVLSAANGGGPAATFQPRLPRAAMDLISTEAVIRATDSLLSQPL
jgi:ADP-heptose:LPS heptosyltransferase